MPFTSLKKYLCIFSTLGLLVFSDGHAEGFDVSLLYGRHSDFWDQIDKLQNNPDPVGQLSQFFDQKTYGSRESVALFNASFMTDSPSFSENYFDLAELGIGIHGLAGGEAYNRIAPNLRGYALWDVSFDASLAKTVRPGFSGWTLLAGTTLGLGRQKLLQGSASDFFNTVPTQDSTLFYTGFDGGIGYVSQFSDYLRFTYWAQISPTFFYTEYDDRNYEYGVRQRDDRWRWRTEHESIISFQPPSEGGFELGGQIFTGQQPTPVKLTPRTWDSVHDMKFVSTFGSVLGLGPVARGFNASRNFLIEVYGGFYGGYFGAGAGLNLYWARLEVGSFGLEQTSGYRVRESRIQYAKVGVGHEW